MLSLALATLVWWMVAGQREAERSLRAPLEFRSIPDQLEVVGEPPGLVDVRLRGTTGALAQLQMSEVVAGLDLKADVPAGGFPYPARLMSRSDRNQAAGDAGDALADLRVRCGMYGSDRALYRR